VIAGAAATIFVVIPFLVTIGLSTTNYSPILPGQDGDFLGLRNYRRALQDPIFRHAAALAFRFAFFSVSASVLLGAAMAVWFYRHPRLTQWALPILLLPSLLAPVVVALVWRYLFQSETGLATYLLRTIAAQSALAPLTNATVAFYLAVWVDVWQWTPLMALILLVGLYSTRRETIEAARVDGASRLRIAVDIFLFNLRPYLVVAIVLRTLDALRAFEPIYVLTGGGPGRATEVLNLYIWRIGFKFWEVGYGAALSVLVYSVTWIVMVLGFRRLKQVLRWV
jgi:multiple sugar transport system permease protein